MRLCFFTVTQKDLDQGHPRTATHCPLVLAMRRAADRWLTELPAVRFVMSRLPRRILDAVKRIDDGRDMPVPATFVVDLDDAWVSPASDSARPYARDVS